MSHRNGIHVAIYGPDGSGKSTVIQQLQEIYSNDARTVFVQHLFPGNGSPNFRSVDDPQGEEPRALLSSLLKMALWGCRYTIGYARFILIPVARGSIVISDRYFPDIIVDPRRYRYGGPEWLPTFMWRLLPKPDRTIMLDAPAATLQQRKQEVAQEETERQLIAYRALVGDSKNGHIVDAGDSIQDVVANVRRLIDKELN